jgi:hypothetical protein
MLWAREIILGDPAVEDKVFCWSTVQLNLPGTKLYNPSRPWVYKAKKDGSLAADYHMYVDD